MASYASKIRGNQDLRSAARSLGMKPGQVSSRKDMRKVRQEARSRAASRIPQSGSGSASAPQSTAQQAYQPATVGGNFVGSGLDTITGLMDRFPGNETIAGMGAGSLFDIGRTQANTGLAIAYNDAFLGSLGQFQSGQENLRTANASKLMAQEGAIARDLTDLTTGRQLEGIKYGADRNLEGTKYGYDSQERQIGLRGREDRLTAERKTIEEKRLRADARGAIRSQGARFYG